MRTTFLPNFGFVDLSVFKLFHTYDYDDSDEHRYRGGKAHLGNVLEPPAERHEDEEHGRSFEECLRVGVFTDNHRHDDNDDGVDVRDAGGEADQHVHVGLAMLQRPQSVYVEISTS